MSRLDLYDRFNMNCVNTEDCSKCKCCDDETGDLILCALMFGYQQGRHDMEQELNQLGECEYNKGRADEKSEIIRIIEECVWKDADMLIGLIKEQK